MSMYGLVDTSSLLLTARSSPSCRDTGVSLRPRLLVEWLVTKHHDIGSERTFAFLESCYDFEGASCFASGAGSDDDLRHLVMAIVPLEAGYAYHERPTLILPVVAIRSVKLPTLRAPFPPERTASHPAALATCYFGGSHSRPCVARQTGRSALGGALQGDQSLQESKQTDHQTMISLNLLCERNALHMSSNRSYLMKGKMDRSPPSEMPLLALPC